MTYIALHVEKWLYGTTRMEMEPDEIACWTYILARAAVTGADPPGLIYYFSEEHLAGQLQVPLELLQRTLEKCEKFKKIKIKPLKRENKYVLSIVNWEKYQHVYLHQKAYRQRQKAKIEAQKKLISEGTKKHNQNITVRRIGEDKIGEDKLKDDRIGEESKDENKSFPSHPRDQFLYILTEFSKDYQYPFQEEADGQIYDYAIKTWRNVVDPIRELEKKIEYWKKNPGALQSKGKSPRVQLHEFLEKEAEYQDGVLEKEKSLDRERNDG